MMSNSHENIVEIAGKCKIFIFDSSFDEIFALEKLLRSQGYSDIRYSADLSKTAEFYKNYKPDIMIMGFDKAYPDGYQVLDELGRAAGEDYLPIIFILAENDKEGRIRALNSDAGDYISRPFEKTEVLIRIKNMLENRILYREVREHNRELGTKVNERTRELQNMQLELIRRLSRAAEVHDQDSGGHIMRIGSYTYEMGRILGFSGKRCNLLKHASMMHDIGKIGIPDHVLQKAAKLNTKEWEQMKTHTLNGGRILTGSSSEVVILAEKIALTHHERWDGAGYPMGLKGEEIPIEGRIVAICDVFDALFSKRAYKEGWKVDEVVNEIKNGSGSHFDPTLTAKFLGNLPKFLEMKEDFD